MPTFSRLFGVVVLLHAARLANAEPFAIEVVDEQTGRGVPLVELTTTGGIAHVTDSAGLVAFDEPGLMNQRVFFHVSSHGYEFRQDGFGIRGAALETKPGGSAQFKIKRRNIAERMYRLTGQGIYRDSVLLGRRPPIREPLLNAQVVGSDSVVNAYYRGKLYWFWGDTQRPKYPLGLFHVPGATSLQPRDGGLDPARGVDLDYFTGEDGFARATAQMAGDGPTWIGGLTVLRDAKDRERMLCGYVKIKPPLEVYRRGLARWNDERNAFEHLADVPLDSPLYPDGHPHPITAADEVFVLFAAPYPLVRTPATTESYADLSQYEAFTCLTPGSRLNKPAIDRDASGRVRYAWKQDTPPVGPAEQARLIQAGLLKSHEGLLQLRDAATGKPVLAHAGSVSYNTHRRRQVLIAVQQYGSSLLGEIWYAEADSPLGPWAYAQKVVTHDQYSFYNPKQHPEFAQEGDRLIYFEGTYTHTFSGNEHRTPRYDYNQIMYRLNLADARLALPLALYDAPGRGRASDFVWQSRDHADQGQFAAIPFFALDRPQPEAVAVYRSGAGAAAKLTLSPPAKSDDAAVEALFWARPADNDEAVTVPLYEYLSAGREAIYSVRDDFAADGFTRSPKPLCRVWPSPYAPPAKP